MGQRTLDDVFDKIEDHGKQIGKLTTKVALTAQATATVAGNLADLNTSIKGKDGLCERVTRVETQLSERTPNRRRLKMAGGAAGCAGLIAYIIYQLIVNPPW